MAIILPKGWIRQPQQQIQVDPKWVALGLNLALLPQGVGLTDCSPKNAIGSGGVRTASSCTQGRTIVRTSGNYAFRGLNQNVLNFSRIAIIRQAATGESVISVSTSATTNNSAQFSTQTGQLQLIASDIAFVASSTGAGLVTGRTHVVGLTYNHAAASTTFYCDGRQLNTVSASHSFVTDGSGVLLVKPNNGNGYTGGLALHLDFNATLTNTQMIALTANPWQVFASAPIIWAVEAGGGGNVTVALTGAAATYSPGTVTPANVVAITGNTSSYSPGNVTPTNTIALTGNASTYAPGTVSVTLTVPLTGITNTYTAGTVSSGSDVTLGITGVSFTYSPGTVSPASAIALTGISSTNSAGIVAPTRAHDITGNSITNSAGTVSPATTKALTGEASTYSAGTLVPSFDISVELTGVEQTYSAGTVSPNFDLSIELTGVEQVYSAGSLNVSTTVLLTGAENTYSPGNIVFTSSEWYDINPATGNSWAPVSITGGDIWDPVNASPGNTWTNI